jgi:hypothetical protein
VPAIRSPKWAANEGPIYGPTIIMAAALFGPGPFAKGFFNRRAGRMCAIGRCSCIRVCAYLYILWYVSAETALYAVPGHNKRGLCDDAVHW